MNAANDAVSRAAAAFEVVRNCDDKQIDQFFGVCADLVATKWPEIQSVNKRDVDRARESGRYTTRLDATESMRDGMIEGLRQWASLSSRVGEVVEVATHDSFRIERRRAPLGVVGFVFEGRPNVVVDGCGVLRGRNTAVMRIGSDALQTAEAIVDLAIIPALTQADLPADCVVVVSDRSHSSAEDLFSNSQLCLAVARGSGPTVQHLGDIARRHGIAVSLHGTGGAWLYVCADADPITAARAVEFSLDRKVCNTLNVILFEGEPMSEVLEALKRRGTIVHEGHSDLHHEWEWESTPEVSTRVVMSDKEAADLFNQYSPRFSISMLTSKPARFESFYCLVDAPYVGNGFTRWVDGQYAFGKPELGLANWERGRLFGRSGILTGEDVYTIRDVFLDLTGETNQRR